MADQPGFTRMPNEIIEAMPDMSEAELRVVLAVARKTIGWGKEWDRLGTKMLIDLTGLSRQGVLDGLEAALSHGWIERRAVKNSYAYCLKTVYSVDHSDDRSTDQTGLPTRPKTVYSVDQNEQKMVYSVDYTKERSKEKKERESERAKKRATPPAKKSRTEKAHDPTLDHLAVVTYRATFKRTPNADQRQAITMAVTDNDLWSEICALWKANRWDYLKVENLINRYQKNGAHRNGTTHRQHSSGRSQSSAERTISREADLDRDF